jgi:hypothetical protein
MNKHNPETSYWRERAEEYLRLAKESLDPPTAHWLGALGAIYSDAMDQVENVSTLGDDQEPK